MNYDKTFTIELGIKVQTTNLKFWKGILKKKVYLALVEYAIEDNDKAKSGYDICRGNDLDNFIKNFK